MNDLADINMEGVKPSGEFKDLEVGQYLVRIEDTEKKPVKDKFDKQTGVPDQDNGKNFLLAVKLKVYEGLDAGHEEVQNLNLWNTNPTAVNMAKSELKAMQMATNVYTPASGDLVGKWMVMEIYLNRNNNKSRKYTVAPANFIPADVAPMGPKVAAAPQSQNYTAAPGQNYVPSPPPAAAPAPIMHTPAPTVAAGGPVVPPWMRKA